MRTFSEGGLAALNQKELSTLTKVGATSSKGRKRRGGSENYGRPRTQGKSGKGGGFERGGKGAFSPE